MNAEASTTEKAPFVSGSLARHVLVMASTGAVGMTAVFLVDLPDLFFLSLLKNLSIYFVTFCKHHNSRRDTKHFNNA